MKLFRSLASLPLAGSRNGTLLVALLCLLAPVGREAAAQNVFPEGSFEQPVQRSSDGTTGWLVGEKPTDKGRIEEKDGNHWLRLENKPGEQSAGAIRRFPLNPEWDAVTVKVRIRVENLVPGKHPWETAKIDIQALDANLQGVPGPGASTVISASPTDTQWKEFTARIELPGNTARLFIYPSIWMASGIMDVDDIQVIPEKVEFNEKEQHATLPTDQKLTWGQEPVEVLSSRREQIVLNGIWQFVPLLDTAETKPPGGFAYIRVPGSWSLGSNVPGLVSERGQGPAWKRWGSGTGKWAAWYQRKIKIPAGWDGRAVVVSLERVSTDAIVYANDVKCGGVSWPYGEVDITKAVKAGEEATLSILVLSTTEGSTEMFLDPGRVITRAAALSSRGLISDVLLSSRPRGTYVSDVFVQTSTRRKQLKLDVEVSDVTAAGPVQFVAKLMDGKGKEERRFQAQANLTGGKKQTVQLSWTWEKPRLWDFKQPNLYTLQLEAKGANLADEYAQSFGFREFWIEGKKFLFNGSEIRLRPVSHTYTEYSMSGYRPLVDAHIDGTIHAGFNIEEMWPVDHDERGKTHFREMWAERADRKGFLLMGTALNLNRGKATEPAYKEAWAKRLEEELRRYRNHPSIVMWTTNPNWLGHGLDQDPRYIGRKKEIPAAADPWRNHSVELAQEGNAVLKKLDSTRPIVNHAGSSVGDVYNINSYLNFIPLQEREEWLSEWNRNGDMPVMAVEFGTPWKDTFFRNRYGHAANSEPWVTEFGAIYLGPQAYALETPAYRQVIAKRFEGGQIYGAWPQEMLIDYAPTYQKIEALFNRDTYRSWRTWGVTGGMIPWDYGYGWDMFWNERRRKGVPDEIEHLGPFKPGTRGLYMPTALKLLTKPFQPEGMDIYPAGVALMEANGPTLAWIAGEKTAFTSKAHNFGAGQVVDKQVVLINDERTPQGFTYAWSAKVNGKEIAKSSGKGSLSPAQTLFNPLQFKVSTAPGKAKADGFITLTAKIGAREHKDSFAFGVFAKPAPSKQVVTLYDPAGKTTKMLAALGITTQPWKAGAAPALTVIGREALSNGKALPFDLEATLRDGGRVLICAQSPAWLRDQLGLRVATFPARRVFPVAKDHPALQNLDAEALSDWAGESTLIEARPAVPLQNPLWRSPLHGWHWGNRGALTSAAIEKPHRSGWRPILECEFDLAYTPLMELDYGKGRLILSTLDLEDHVSQDAAAVLLARNLIEYAATAKPVARAQRTIHVGDDNDKKTLDGLGVLYEPAARIEPDADLVIIGQRVNCDEPQVQSYLEKGGRMLFLAREAAAHALSVKLEQAPTFAGSLQVPAWPEAQGLSASDLRWRSESPAWLVKAGAEVGADGLLGRLRVGKGVALFCQIDPDQLQADTKTYFRFTRWRQTRVLSQLLANLGATFAGDKNSVGLSKAEGGFYHPDYRTDFELGDDPYRYFRW